MINITNKTEEKKENKKLQDLSPGDVFRFTNNFMDGQIFMRVDYPKSEIFYVALKSGIVYSFNSTKEIKIATLADLTVEFEP